MMSSVKKKKKDKINQNIRKKRKYPNESEILTAASARTARTGGRPTEPLAQRIGSMDCSIKSVGEEESSRTLTPVYDG